jgi:superfamily I DNA and/or RNA helicase
MQGTHPEGTGISALEYILDGAQTIRADQGLFLGETWRLHPKICDFTSEVFYESRLQPIKGLELQEIKSGNDCPKDGATDSQSLWLRIRKADQSRASGPPSPGEGRTPEQPDHWRTSGLRYMPVVHTGNQNSSPEEAEVIRQLVAEILGSATSWVDRLGAEKSVGLEDILIIAPYNAQVFDLKDRIPGARIGTVDKFQGQEAPIVIYSMTTSTSVDAPRGMNFLYSLNRLNVATSRAKSISILVCSPQLFEPECKTPEQMRMANAFCRYLELATTI